MVKWFYEMTVCYEITACYEITVCCKMTACYEMTVCYEITLYCKITILQRWTQDKGLQRESQNIWCITIFLEN